MEIDLRRAYKGRDGRWCRIDCSGPRPLWTACATRVRLDAGSRSRLRVFENFVHDAGVGIVDQLAFLVVDPVRQLLRVAAHAVADARPESRPRAYSIGANERAQKPSGMLLQSQSYCLRVIVSQAD